MFWRNLIILNLGIRWRWMVTFIPCIYQQARPLYEGKGEMNAHSKPWVYKTVKDSYTWHLLYGLRSDMNMEAKGMCLLCSSTLLSVTLMTPSSYITEANKICLILGWDETMSLVPVTSNRPSTHTTDDRWMNMNTHVMIIDRQKPKRLGKTGVLNLLSSDDGNTFQEVTLFRYRTLDKVQNPCQAYIPSH